MLLTVAKGSSGYYMVDEEGRTHTCCHFVVGLSMIPAGRKDGPGPLLEPGQRPTRSMQSYVGPGSRPYWLPTGQVEKITDEQLAQFAVARRARDEVVARADAAAEELYDAEARMEELLASIAS